ncbi:MAG: hypothetical protein ACLSAC_18540 [Enterocloster bolteae]
MRIYWTCRRLTQALARGPGAHLAKCGVTREIHGGPRVVAALVASAEKNMPGYGPVPSKTATMKGTGSLDKILTSRFHRLSCDDWNASRGVHG